MAKSLRSKWRRKCRAVKRVRYEVKELDRLKKTLGIDDNASKDVEMSDIAEIATVVDAKKVREDIKAKQTEDPEPDSAAVGEHMQVEAEGAKIYNKRTLRDQHGNYPVWMSHRRIMKQKMKQKMKKGRPRSQKASNKTGRRLTRRQKKVLKQQN